MSTPTTLLIVDDHEEFRLSARALLESDGFRVVGEAIDGASALASIDAERPDLVLLDITLPGPDGITVAARIAERHDPPLVVLISSRSSEVYGERLAAVTAAGFLRKDVLSGAALRELLR